jgi:hypothetical protein
MLNLRRRDRHGVDHHRDRDHGRGNTRRPTQPRQMVTVATDDRRPPGGHAGERSSAHRADKSPAGLGARLAAVTKPLLDAIRQPIELDVTWSRTSSAEQFRLLTRGQQDRLLNSGYRPYPARPDSL